LKLIADVGLVGEPNAGKSTFLATVTAARPKVAGYPFTTLSPNLGVVGLSGGRSLVLADIPGIIEGAAEGKGLGAQFLRHIERTRTLALLIPADVPEAQVAYERLREELRQHDAALAIIPHCVVVTKSDLVPPEAQAEFAQRIEAPDAWGTFVISSVARHGLEELTAALWERVDAAKALERQAAEAERQDHFPELDDWRP